MSASKKVALKDTEHKSLSGARAKGPSSPHQLLEISVVLKHRQPLPRVNSLGRLLSHTEFAIQYGADPTSVDNIHQFARENRLQMLERGDEVLHRTVTLAGTTAAMEKAFSVELIEFEYEDGSYRGHTGPIQIPEEYSAFVCGVFGLDNRPVAEPHFRYRAPGRSPSSRPHEITYTGAQVAKLYGFPENATAPGQTIGFIELGGGYRPGDIAQYFQNLGLQPPLIKCISVDHGKNRPTSYLGPDGQVMLNIEVAGTVAPGVWIALCVAPNTARGFQDALSEAVHDQLNKPSVISIGWGSAESNWTKQSMQNFTEVCQEAALLGITLTAASGSNGSSDGLNDGKNHVDFPASCPYVLACGGTRLTSANGAIVSEAAWDDGPQSGQTGGGYSQVFTRPDWQATDVAREGRGVPDVAGSCDPGTGYKVLVDGEEMIAGEPAQLLPCGRA